MIFARRAMQRRLDELRKVLPGPTIDALAKRFNEPGKDRMAVMWEVAVLSALSRHGKIENEKPLPSGRRPDVRFDDTQLRFTSDVTSVSDEGLDAANPFSELLALIEKQKAKLNLPIGGLDLKVLPKRVEHRRGVRTVLRLPPRKELRAFVSQEIIPRLREQMDAGKKVLRVEFENDNAGLTLTIDPSKRFSGGQFAAYDIPTIKDRNPVYSALKDKADQLKGAEGLTGVIVGDGDCVALADRGSTTPTRITSEAIAKELFRQYSSVDFVLYLTIGERRHGWPSVPPPERWVKSLLVVRAGCPAKAELEALFTKMISEMPKPVQMPVNGAMRAREPDYQLGHHGGFQNMGGKKVQMSSREFVETLAGIRTLGDNGARNIEASRKQPDRESHLQSFFLRQLKEGCLPCAIKVIKTDEHHSDDWIEIEFGDPDPAIAPLR